MDVYPDSKSPFGTVTSTNVSSSAAITTGPMFPTAVVNTMANASKKDQNFLSCLCSFIPIPHPFFVYRSGAVRTGFRVFISLTDYQFFLILSITHSIDFVFIL